MTAYAIAEVKIRDKEKYETEFMPAVLQAHQLYDAKVLARSDNAEVLAGHGLNGRVVIMQFRDLAHARTWFASAEMQRALDIGRTCTGDVMILLLEDGAGFPRAEWPSE
jgi:uncharacterized protein (DUF1330 family)